MAAKHQRVREEISSSNEKLENYKSNIRDETDLDQAGDEKNLL